MNGSIKLLLYILFVAVIFLFVQDRFNIFDIDFRDSGGNEEDVGEEKTEGERESVELYNEDGKTILVTVEVADTELLRMTGLSGRRNLGDYEGMLFIMDSEAISGFWMKDMYIGLDIIYIDSKGFIVDIKENLKPCEVNYCPTVYSNEPFKYVLEVNEGFSESNRVRVGNSVIFNISSMD
ncbi:MAG: DUF192 domain-containing protein [Candidatus Dojkabacteria bacterium]|jgi:uncharacterized membrane protein (UPF0127 family)|nr:DUF192 domain-containing protein [Candidatus Dojkabacteria bacterium]